MSKANSKPDKLTLRALPIIQSRDRNIIHTSTHNNKVIRSGRFRILVSDTIQFSRTDEAYNKIKRDLRPLSTLPLMEDYNHVGLERIPAPGWKAYRLWIANRAQALRGEHCTLDVSVDAAGRIVSANPSELLPADDRLVCWPRYSDDVRISKENRRR